MTEEMFMKFDHIGLVVKDMEKSINYYETLGIGPFERSTSVQLDRKFRGKSIDDMQQDVRKAMMGTTGLQLIQPVSGSSPQMEFLQDKGEGINHIAFLVSDLPKAVEQMVARGYKIIYSQKYARGGGEVYLDTNGETGFYIQLFQRSP
jgi:methylmalonyl-CoA/ethylmalonyl-CoA epimerase